jgi:beta-aspartyl-dipeptidase (metallo-type)
MDAPMLTLIRGASLFAPEALGEQDLLLGGGRILAMAPALSPSGFGNALREIDGRGLLAVPGLIDSLVHTAGGGGEGGFASRIRPLEAEQALRAGVTTLIGALGTDDSTRSHADLLACGRALSAHGLSAFALSGSYHVPLRTLTGSLRDDIVLIPDIIGAGEVAIADHRGAQPSCRELARIAAEAHVGGMLSGKAGTLLVHVGDGRDGLGLLRACVAEHEVSAQRFLPTHCNRSRRLVDEARDWVGRGGWIDLTASTTSALLAAGEVPAAHALRELLADARCAGRVTLSSDGQASLPHFDQHGRLLRTDTARVASLLVTLREACALGLELPIALSALTSTPARVWGLADKGALRVGAAADLLLLDPDRLQPRITVAGGRLWEIGEGTPREIG